MEETLEERQDNELEALQAIFGDDIQDKRKFNNGKWSPLDIELTVYPQQGSNAGRNEFHAGLNLRVQCSKEYPNKVPHIQLTKSKGLSTQQLINLRQELNDLMNEWRGEVMVFNLVQHIQKVLHEYNKPGYQSFYDEMMMRQQLQDQQEMLLKKAEEDRMRQQVLDEIHFKQEAIRDELKRKRNSIPTTQKSESDTTGSPPTIESPKRNYFKQNFKELDDNSSGTEDMLTQWKSLAHSRIDKEFQLLDWIGKGAFGDVLKVRNKLDDRLYAIKRIQLNPKNKQLNKKIMREVKLLSRLNHENVVRYYNSWIESGHAEDRLESEDQSLDISMEKVKHNGNGIDLQPLQPCNMVDTDIQSDSDTDSVDEDWISFLPGSRSVLNGETDSDSSEDTPMSSVSSSEEMITNINIVQYMYIQMEFCEKSTLRSAIDNGLCEDISRVWRLLREIVEGLSHIHSQGIIHRDLKPVNIFIDFEDHVKIGDFGLATNILQKHAIPRENTGFVVPNTETSVYHNENSHTGQVGTALYAAPELDSHGFKAMYNQKVDIYSLGIIFFEMCYHPLNTSMERLKILSDLRLKEIKLPPEFCTPETCRQSYIVRWLLNHDSSKRPSSEQILMSDHLPPPQVQETVLHEMVRQTLSNPQSKGYKYLIAGCFNQKVSPADDITYDISLNRNTNFSHLERTADTLRHIFQLHGGVYFQTPLLTPLNMMTASFETTTSIMTRSGSIVTVPHDLRIPFARYLAQNNHIISLKRYCIDRVYRERRVLGFHPRELYECAFDIVTSSPGNLMAEAELISMTWEIVNEFPSLLDKNCLIRLNHSHLVTGILLHCGVELEKHGHVCSVLRNTKVNEVNDLANAKTSKLSDLDLAEYNINSLVNLMSLEQPYSKAVSQLKPLLRKNTLASTYIKQALKQLESVIASTESLGVKCPLMITPGLLTDIDIYSGILFQLVWDQKNKHNRWERDVVAVGGRYDNLISSFKTMLDVSKESSISQSAAGVSLSLDKLVAGIQCEHLGSVDVLICSMGQNLLHSKLNIVKDLWAAGVRCTVMDQQEDFEGIQTHCLETKIPYIVFIKDTEPSIARLRSFVKDRFQEKRVNLNDLVETLLRLLRNENQTNLNSRIRTNSEARQNNNCSSIDSSLTPDVNVTLLIEEKLSAVAKRRYEHQIITTLSSSLQKLSPKVKIEVIALHVESDFIRTIVAMIDIKDTSSVLKKFPRHKKILSRVYDFLDNISGSPVLVFYSLIDSMYKFVL